MFKGPTLRSRTSTSNGKTHRRREREEAEAFSDESGESSSGSNVGGGSGSSSGRGGGEKEGHGHRLCRKCSRSPEPKACCAPADPSRGEGDRAWSARRRDPRVNGADIYVVRVTKMGMGSAKPCWRCLEWCRWAGVKRIFHWNVDEGKFDVVKVNTAEKDQYTTHSDIRLYAGKASPLSGFSCDGVLIL